MDPNCILELLDLTDNTMSDTEDPIEESEEEIEENSESRNSEVDISENDDEEMDTGMQPWSTFYIGKDKKTKWIREKPPSNTRTRGHNIVTHLPGCRPIAKNKNVITEYFFFFFFDDVIIRSLHVQILKLKVLQKILVGRETHYLQQNAK